MKSGTATALVADKSVSYGAERILAIVRGLQQEIKEREADFELRLKRTVEETVATTHKEVTQTLSNRFDLEISTLRATFDRRLRELVDETEALAQAKLQSALTEAKDGGKLVEKLKQDASANATEWQAERQRLEARIAGLESLVDTVNARAQAEARSEADRAMHGEVAAMVQSEMIRVRTLLDEIETTLAGSSTDLGSEMRLNRERSELQAYLKGLLYSLGEASKPTSWSFAQSLSTPAVELSRSE